MSTSSSTTTSMLTFTGDHAKDYNTVTIFRDKSGVSQHSSPDSDVPLPTLEYFALRGLGELPRLLLEYYGMEYKNVYYFSNDTSWKARKPSTILGYMPIFSDQYVNNLAESGAILSSSCSSVRSYSTRGFTKNGTFGHVNGSDT